MDAIVAVYDDWGIGCDGDQPIAISADRKFFRSTTKDSTVIVGRKTLQAFPGGQPLPKRRNIVMTRQDMQMEGVEFAGSPEEAMQMSENDGQVFVIGGGTVYNQMLPLCSRAYVTKVHVTPKSDTWFENLDESAHWKLKEILQSGEENGIRYEMCLYVKTD